jgi:hypothetical protein
MTKTVIAVVLGECVQGAVLSDFLRLAEAAGWRTVLLDSVESIEDVLAAVRREEADASTEIDELLDGVSHRLTPRPESACWESFPKPPWTSRQ